jgi:hypothetical protein
MPIAASFATSSEATISRIAGSMVSIALLFLFLRQDTNPIVLLLH